MPERIALTEARVVKMQPPSKGRYFIADATNINLQVCVSSAGLKTFYLVRRMNGQPTRYCLGRHPGLTVSNARKAAEKKLGEIADGQNPQAERMRGRKALTVGELFEKWLVHAKQRKRTWKDDERQIDKYFGPIKERGVRTLTAAAVIDWHAKIGTDHGPVQANRCLFLLSTLLNYAIEKLEAIEHNVCRKVDRFPERSRERFLLPDEMKAFFKAVAAEEPLWRDFFLLCLLTGARRGNVAAMRWDELDLERSVWLIPGAKTKNKKPHAIPLSPPTMIVLRSREATRGGSPYVFPSGRVDGAIADPRKAWSRVLKESGISNLRMHDLRRSMGSWQATLGASLSIIGASLGHADLQSTQVYSRLTLDPVRASMAQAGQQMLTAGGMTITTNGVEPVPEAAITVETTEAADETHD